MTKDKIPYLIILILIIISTILYFRGNPKQTDTTDYKHQIDSLQYNIDSLKINNELIFDSIHILNGEKEWYNDQVINLQKQLKNEKKKTQSMVDAVDAWIDNDVQWFFTNRYKGFFPDSITNPISKISR